MLRSLVVLLVGMGSLASAADVWLVDAVKKGDRAAVAALLARHADVNAAEPDGTTPLHWAVERDDLDMAQGLIRAGANVKAANRYGVTPSTLACINGTAKMLETLLQAGAGANTALPEGETLLMTAARTGKVDALNVLLAHGANVNAKEEWRGQTALMWAAAEKHPAAAKALLDHGADIRVRSKGGLTPLLFAVRSGDPEVVRLLVDAGSEVNDKTQDGTSALVLAVINAHYDIAALLLERGADPNAADPRGSALHALAFMRRPGFPAAPSPAPSGNGLDLAKALLAHKANPNVRIAWKEIVFDRDQGVVKSPPNIALGRSYLSFIGATPFYVAARGGDVELMRVLVAGGADPKLPTAQNVTPLMAAAGLGFWDGESPATEPEALAAVKLAWELGNDVNAIADFGNQPAETDGTALLRRHFLDLKDAVGDMRWSGCTALHGAALRGADSIVQFLAEKGARLDSRAKIGWTPLDLADGVFVANTVKVQPSTSALIRSLMRGKTQAP